jgi:hypothetical protein
MQVVASHKKIAEVKGIRTRERQLKVLATSIGLA